MREPDLTTGSRTKRKESCQTGKRTTRINPDRDSSGSYGPWILLLFILGVGVLLWWINSSGAGGPTLESKAPAVDVHSFTSPPPSDAQFESKRKEQQFNSGQPNGVYLTPEQRKSYENLQQKHAPTPRPFNEPIRDSADNRSR